MELNYKETCAICGRTCDVKNHVKMHKISSKEYYDTYIRKEKEGICKTCGEDTRFLGLIRGYTPLYCSNACKAHNPIEKAKHSQTMINIKTYCVNKKVIYYIV